MESDQKLYAVAPTATSVAQAVQLATHRLAARGWPGSTLEVAKSTRLLSRGSSIIRVILIQGEPIRQSTLSTYNMYKAAPLWLGEDGKLYQLNSAVFSGGSNIPTLVRYQSKFIGGNAAALIARLLELSS